MARIVNLVEKFVVHYKGCGATIAYDLGDLKEEIEVDLDGRDCYVTYIKCPKCQSKIYLS